MPVVAQLWRSPADVVALAAAWHAGLADRRLATVAGGPGWLRLTLIDDDDAREDDVPPAHLYLMARPGAVVLWDTDTVVPPSWDRALGRIARKRLTVTSHLVDARLTDVAAPVEDRIVYFGFTGTDGRRRVLAHQLFGPRGNLVLTDETGKRLWSAHPSPHPATLDPPPPPARADVDPDLAADFRDRATTHLHESMRAEASDRARTSLRRAAATATRHQQNLARDLQRAERGDDARRDGETLAIHLHELTQGPPEVSLLDGEGRTRVIALDPSRTPAENMADCFKRARKADRGRDLIAGRLAEVQGRQESLEALEKELTELLAGEADLLETLPAWHERHTDLLGEWPRPDAKRRFEEEARPFRRYRLDDRWDVWVGRNNQENDELTHHASAPDDWWFHAQGVSGSHVILRTGGRPDQVPRHALERAAAIAAYHSKARTSGYAPVVYTQRKYVRKPRKSPPGTASCIREKSLMVEPGLPPNDA